ncbi:hypothetical protein LK994_01215 [Ferruginibacter lapsinanis]|uniref:DUF7670 domain-containing protein n=1 Tax=Ferruginibacter lapsinanis TaxID=563172 RepID=UPI001E3F423D|nr:hypothetical protein [Ferruginibacter lapsinanis]UEG50093.1 hypothetical protein LK994_01215 [Ferruginibacter lapsinanis]
MSHHKKQAHHIRPYKIMAQTFGLMVCCFFVLYLIGNDLPNMIRREDIVLASFLPLAVIPVAGYILTWYKEFPGALLMTLGGFLLVGYFLSRSATDIALFTGIPFILAGGLYMLHIQKRKALQNQH